MAGRFSSMKPASNPPDETAMSGLPISPDALGSAAVSTVNPATVPTSSTNARTGFFNCSSGWRSTRESLWSAMASKHLLTASTKELGSRGVDSMFHQDTSITMVAYEC